MLTGLLCALGAGLMWGLVFIAPLMLPDYPGIMLSFGRYVAFGLIALVPALLDRKRVAVLTKADWRAALKLSLIGNLLYYAALATAIQLADAPLPTMLIGTLPVVISVFSNWSPGHAAESVAWRRLAPSLIIILVGILCVNAAELAHMRAAASEPGNTRTMFDYVLGCLLALGGVAAWTWYPIVNARYLRANPHISSSTWATAQGLATLPLALVGLFGYGAYLKLAGGVYAFPFGPRPLQFVGLMLVIGLCASWIGILLWNKASQHLPTALLAQLIVFETLSALLYAFIFRGAAPSLQVVAGIVLLCIGIVFGVRTFQHQIP
ncbi:inner membrane protein ytfF [Collimonas arenae]|uniref:Inner membrane protein ytfF n=1 Tax=Collimonas arenae TaxID=279058 RepID=A0A127PL44_9BURK|nr:DMT family transporter [Collimonas arenae]AMO98463.1 inner membrane protein ytfF [Collimonas arenae]AMP08350.1 inner membrane protein ytfF [Collimonas arenae]